MTQAKTFGEVLRRFRKRAGLTQAEVGEACGAAPQTVSAWERGRGRPSFPACADMARVLEVDPVELSVPAGVRPELGPEPVSPDVPLPFGVHDRAEQTFDRALRRAYEGRGELSLPQRLREIRWHLRLGPELLAEQLGVSPAQITAWEEGVARPGLVALLKLATLSDIDPRMLLEIWAAEAKQQRKGRTIWRTPSRVDFVPPWTPARKMPLFDLGGASDFEWSGADLPETQRLVQLPATDANAFACMLRGDSMEPYWSDGDIVVFSPSAEVDSGDVVLLRLPDRARFSRVFLDTNEEAEFDAVAVNMGVSGETVLTAYQKGSIVALVKMVAVFRRY